MTITVIDIRKRYNLFTTEDIKKRRREDHPNFKRMMYNHRRFS